MSVSKTGNINYIQENDYSITSKNIDIWEGDYPHYKGERFPSDKLRERASISKTNAMLYANDFTPLNSILTDGIFGISPVLLNRIKEIIADEPIFKIMTDAFISHCCATLPTVDSPDGIDIKLSSILSNSNFYESIEYLFKCMFLDPITTYVVRINKLGEIKIQFIPVKNCIVYNDPEDITCTYCIETFNIIEDKVEFIDYFTDGRIQKRTFEYKQDTLGDMIGDVEEELAYNGKYPVSPAGFMANNPEKPGDTYGTDQFRYWDGPIAAVCRSFMNLFRLGEKAREVSKITHEDFLTETDGNGHIDIGSDTFVRKGHLDKEQRPEIEYIIPELRNNIEAEIAIVDKNLKALAMSSGLSIVHFDIEKLGSNLSAKALRALMWVTLQKVAMLCTKMTGPLKEMIQKIALFGDLQINKGELDITWHYGIQEEDERLDYISKRLENRTMSLEDALVELDGIDRRTARERANKLRNINAVKVEPESSIEGASETTVDGNNINFNNKNTTSEDSGVSNDDKISQWENNNNIPAQNLGII